MILTPIGGYDKGLGQEALEGVYELSPDMGDDIAHAIACVRRDHGKEKKAEDQPKASAYVERRADRESRN
jgi:hypothetical protein